MIAEVYHLSSFIFYKTLSPFNPNLYFLFTKNNKKGSQNSCPKNKSRKMMNYR
ncbi:MAG: hypothetical protein V9E96_02920 [Chitinophagaceae bacterium]|jgi:hypothetical protein